MLAVVHQQQSFMQTGLDFSEILARIRQPNLELKFAQAGHRKHFFILLQHQWRGFKLDSELSDSKHAQGGRHGQCGQHSDFEPDGFVQEAE